MLQQARKYSYALEMHLLHGQKAPKIPTLVWFLFAQIMMTLMCPVVFPELRETQMWLLSLWMLLVNFSVGFILLMFVLRVTINTVVADKAKREQILAAYQLGTGDISSISEAMAPDILVAQMPDETAEDYKLRLSAAKMNASNSVWVVALIKGNPFAVIYTSPSGEGMAINRRCCPWEIEKHQDERIVSASFDFLTETNEKFALFAARFCHEWKPWAIAKKPEMLMASDPMTALNVIIEQVKNN